MGAAGGVAVSVEMWAGRHTANRKLVLLSQT